MGLGSVILVILLLFFELYIGYINWGQEFGAMGQYNRVAHVLEDMKGYSTPGNRLNRELEFKHLSHLNFFSYKVKTPNGAVAEVRFDYGTPPYEEKNETRLKEIILQKIESQLE